VFVRALTGKPRTVIALNVVERRSFRPGCVQGSPDETICVRTSSFLSNRFAATLTRGIMVAVDCEQGKNFVLHLSNWQFLHPKEFGSSTGAEQYIIGGSEKLPRKKAKTGGSDPTFSAFSRPKSAWGSLPPLVRTKDAEKNHTRAERGGLSFGN
jgi:hypothetical protein